MNATSLITAYQRSLVVFAFVLGGLTWRLWTPQTVFPQVPLFEALITAPPWLDWLAISTLVGSLAACLFATRTGRYRAVTCCSITICTGTLIALDQHRCQPWAYQFAIVALVLALTQDRQALPLMRALVISIYIYSALGKLDYQFLFTVGQQFLQTLGSLFGLDSRSFAEPIRLSLVACFPLIELAIGIGLARSSTRRFAAVAAVVMHVVLMLILGPAGLNHHWGVLGWNAFFAIQAILLFWVKPASAETQQTDVRTKFAVRSFLANAIILIVIVLPVGERAGVVDHWLSWALYAPHSSRATIDVSATALDRLPAELRRIVDSSNSDELWIEVPISRWSLEQLAAPIYPQARFQVGVAEHLARGMSEFDLRVTIQSTSSRFTGARKRIEITGSSALRNAESFFRLNCHPRLLPKLSNGDH